MVCKSETKGQLSCVCKEWLQVETNVVVPIHLASDKREIQCAHFRPKLWKHAEAFLKPLPAVQTAVPNAAPLLHLLRWTRLASAEVKDVDVQLAAPSGSEGWEAVDVGEEAQMEALLARLDIDRSVSRVACFKVPQVHFHTL